MKIGCQIGAIIRFCSLASDLPETLIPPPELKNSLAIHLHNNPQFLALISVPQSATAARERFKVQYFYGYVAILLNST